MHIPPFKIERYFARYEFSAPYLLSCSDCDPLSLPDLLALADAQTRNDWDNLWLGYTDSQGEPAVREEISSLYTTIKPESLCVVTPIEGIFIAMNVLLKKDDHCIVTFPGYQSLYEVARSIGCDVSYWKPVEEKGWYFDLNHLESLITDKTRLIVINFPHNPTGSTITKEQLNDIVELARKHNITLFSDEMYRFLEKERSLLLPSASDLYENALSLSGMSKAFALPGLRIGWLATQNSALLNGCMTFKDYTTICSSAPSQMLAVIALKAKETILAKNLDIIARNTERFHEFITQWEDLFSWYPPQAGSVAFVRYKGAQGVAALSKQLIDSEGIMILPSTVFDYGDQHWRIGLGRKNVPEVLDQLNEYLSKKS